MNKKLYYGIVAVLVIGVVVIFSMIGVKMYTSKKAPKTPQLVKATPTSLSQTTDKMELYNETKDSWITIHEGSTYNIDFMTNEGLGVVEKAMRTHLKGKPLSKVTYTKLRLKHIRGKGKKSIKRNGKKPKTVSYGGKTYPVTSRVKFIKDGQTIPCVTISKAMEQGVSLPPIFTTTGKKFGKMKEMRKKSVIATPFYKHERKKDKMIITFTFPEPFTVTNPEEDTAKLEIKFDFKDTLHIDMENKICWPIGGTPKCYATLEE